MPLRTKSAYAIYSLWRDWALTMSAPTVLAIMCLGVPAVWLPIVAFAFAGALLSLTRWYRHSPMPGCALVPFVMSRVMLWGGFIMLFLAAFYVHGPFEQYFGETNSRYPFIAALVLAPTSAIVSGIFLLRGRRNAFCQDCQMRIGSEAELGFLGRLFGQEGRFQLAFLFKLSVFLTVICYAYYWTFYINVNLNTPDRFIFVWTPVIFNILSMGYMGMRYFSLWMYYGQDAPDLQSTGAMVSRVRFLIVDDSRFLLSSMCPSDIALPGLDKTSLSFRFDTPLALSLPFRQRLSVDEARRLFAEAAGRDDFDIRFMYLSKTADGHSNAFHYIVTVPSDFTETSNIKGEWFSLIETSRLLNSGRLESMLAAEIHRLYIITMAWKTYDREGRRLYKIKNYKPVFRLRGINKWPVDFNDPHWLMVAHNNQDRPFFHIRKLWHRMVHGNT